MRVQEEVRACLISNGIAHFCGFFGEVLASPSCHLHGNIPLDTEEH